tara:strand:+ start:5323 stop:5697 length:375 start_codon:yes stop_codon:yes gene_type:complete
MKTPYDVMGGEPVVRALVHEFYKAMDTMPEVKKIRDMHKSDLKPMEERLSLYLMAWLGGPRTWLEQGNGMCMTEPHAPYKIDAEARDMWMMCMDAALEAVNLDKKLVEVLRPALADVADMVRNA